MQSDTTIMQKHSLHFRHLMQLTAMVLRPVLDTMRFLRLCLRSPTSLAAENLFLRKQLALYQGVTVQSVLKPPVWSLNKISISAGITVDYSSKINHLL
jgi:hypothetical protein